MKKILIGIIIVLTVSTTGILAANYLYKASGIEYEPQDEQWNVDNVQGAISDLYSMIDTNNLKDLQFNVPTYYSNHSGNIDITFDQNYDLSLITISGVTTNKIASFTTNISSDNITYIYASNKSDILNSQTDNFIANTTHYVQIIIGGVKQGDTISASGYLDVGVQNYNK